MRLVFVYGTLKRGQPNHGRMIEARFLANAHTAKEFSLHDLSTCPGMAESDPTGVVSGELYVVDACLLQILDRFEGHPHVYKRKRIRVFSDSGRKFTAYAYIIQPGHYEHGRGISREWHAKAIPLPHTGLSRPVDTSIPSAHNRAV